MTSNAPSARARLTGGPGRGRPSPMFIFFSNRLGCLGSIAVTLIGTLLLLGILWLINR